MNCSSRPSIAFCLVLYVDFKIVMLYDHITCVYVILIMLPCTFVSHKFMKCSMSTCDHTVGAKIMRDMAFPVPLFQHDDSMH